MPEALRRFFAEIKRLVEDRGFHHAACFALTHAIKAFFIACGDLWGRIHGPCLLFYSRIFRRPVIHVIGDSHSLAFRGKDPFVVHYLGSATAYAVMKTNSTTGTHDKVINILGDMRSKDIVLLSFGEIDCRAHIYKEFERNDGRTPIAELIDRTISNYGEMMKQTAQRGITTCVYSVPPATITINRRYWESEYPFYGSPEIRADIHRIFNQRLEEFCKVNGYHYIDVYSKVCDNNGLRLEEYAADDIHLNGRALKFARRELRNKLNIRL
jgi:lysophospholipase L1-like esterase